MLRLEREGSGNVGSGESCDLGDSGAGFEASDVVCDFHAYHCLGISPDPLRQWI
jgi:hypothetical protein